MAAEEEKTWQKTHRALRASLCWRGTPRPSWTLREVLEEEAHILRCAAMERRAQEASASPAASSASPSVPTEVVQVEEEEEDREVAAKRHPTPQKAERYVVVDARSCREESAPRNENGGPTSTTIPPPPPRPRRTPASKVAAKALVKEEREKEGQPCGPTVPFLRHPFTSSMPIVGDAEHSLSLLSAPKEDEGRGKKNGQVGEGIVVVDDDEEKEGEGPDKTAPSRWYDAFLRDKANGMLRTSPSPLLCAGENSCRRPSPFPRSPTPVSRKRAPPPIREGEWEEEEAPHRRLRQETSRCTTAHHGEGEKARGRGGDGGRDEDDVVAASLPPPFTLSSGATEMPRAVGPRREENHRHPTPPTVRLSLSLTGTNVASKPAKRLTAALLEELRAMQETSPPPDSAREVAPMTQGDTALGEGARQTIPKTSTRTTAVGERPEKGGHDGSSSSSSSSSPLPTSTTTSSSGGDVPMSFLSPSSVLSRNGARQKKSVDRSESRSSRSQQKQLSILDFFKAP